MSSCGRPLRETVRADTAAYAWPVTQLGQVDVVGGQVHDHADVGDAVRERALAPGDDLVDVAQLARLQPAAQALQRRVVPLDVADAGDQALGLERVDQPARRLHRLARAASRSARRTPASASSQADLLVQRGRAGDDRVVDAERDQLRRRSAAPAPRGPSRAGRRPGRRRRPARRRPARRAPGRGCVPSRPARSGRRAACAWSLRPAQGVHGVGDPVELVRASATGRSAATAPRRRPGRSPAGPSRPALPSGGQVRLEPVDRRRVVDGVADAQRLEPLPARASRSPGTRTVYWW